MDHFRDFNTIKIENRGKIDSYETILARINNLRRTYMPGNKKGIIDFLKNVFPSIYKSFNAYLSGKIIYIDRVVATKRDVDYFNMLYRSKVKIKLK